MNYLLLLKKVEAHILSLFQENSSDNLYYHNLKHTRNVVESVNTIALAYDLDEKSLFILSAAAWFHDIGYLVVSPELHEQQSAEMADSFLKSLEVPAEEIEAIKKCIMATKMPQSPEVLLEKILCDADLFYLGTDSFKEKSKMLRKEIEALGNKKLSGIEWRTEVINFLSKQNYHTDYCREFLDKPKAEHLSFLNKKQEEKQIEKAQLLVAAQALPISVSAELEKVKPTSKTKEKSSPSRSIETLFRISSTNAIRVSSMADNKAHIMINVNAIIMSVVLGLLLKNLDENQYLLIPTIILLFVNVSTIIYAVLATRPNIANGKFTQEELDSKSVNLLFFGSFHKMNYSEYEAGIKSLIGDTEFLYNCLTKDIFWQGKVLGRKFKLLRISYTIFMYGIVASVIAFAAASILAS